MHRLGKDDGGKEEPISHFSNKSTSLLGTMSMQLKFDKQIPRWSMKIVVGAVKLHFFKLQQNSIITPPNGINITTESFFSLFFLPGGGGIELQIALEREREGNYYKI